MVDLNFLGLTLKNLVFSFKKQLDGGRLFDKLFNNDTLHKEHSILPFFRKYYKILTEVCNKPL